jgi:hypothetical protein
MLGNALVGQAERAPEASEIAKAFIYRVFFDIGGV